LLSTASRRLGCDYPCSRRSTILRPWVHAASSLVARRSNLLRSARRCPKSRRGHVSKAREPRGRTSRRLCGSLAFEARTRRARSTVVSRLVRKAG
jgi:hypothetical protein